MAEFKIEILKENTEDNELKAFLNHTDNCTIFHRPEFLAYHSKEKFNSFKEFSFCHLIFRNEKNNITAFIPGAIYLSDDNKKIYKTPFYSSYGGMVYDIQLKFKDFEQITGLFISYIKTENVQEIYFTQTPDCYCGDESEKNNYISYLLKLNGFDLVNLEMIFVKKTNDHIIDGFHNTIKRQIKQALENNLEFRSDGKITDEAYKLLEKSQSRLGGKPTHSFEELNLIQNSFPDNIVTFSTLHNGKLIAGIIGFICNPRVLNTFYIFDDEANRELKGMQFTYYNVLNWANERKIKYADFGPATFGLKPHHSLINYKEKYGSLPLLRKTYYVRFE